MDAILTEKFKFTADFFENAIQKNKLFHSYLLTGNDNVAKYAFALNIARILNCTGDKSENCECTNCKWIRDNAHPAVMTFSPIDFVHVNERGQAKENITVAQARFIKEELSKNSTYHRILIITNAAEGQEAESGYSDLRSFDIKPPVQVGMDNDVERIWAPKSLKPEIFTSDTANTLLKTIEEPFENVTFFFLANSPEDLMQTIVSRCQQVCIPSRKQFNDNFDIVEKIIKNFPARDALTAILMAEEVKNISKEHEISILDVLEILEEFYGLQLTSNLENISNYRLILTFLNKIENAKSQIKCYVNVDSVLENLFF